MLSTLSPDTSLPLDVLAPPPPLLNAAARSVCSSTPSSIAEKEDQSTELSGGRVLDWLDVDWRKIGEAARVCAAVCGAVREARDHDAARSWSSWPERAEEREEVETAELERACRRRLAVLEVLRGGREIVLVAGEEEEGSG